jgi:hypothetical protein
MGTSSFAVAEITDAGQATIEVVQPDGSTSRVIVPADDVGSVRLGHRDQQLLILTGPPHSSGVMPPGQLFALDAGGSAVRVGATPSDGVIAITGHDGVIVDSSATHLSVTHDGGAGWAALDLTKLGLNDGAVLGRPAAFNGTIAVPVGSEVEAPSRATAVVSNDGGRTWALVGNGSKVPLAPPAITFRDDTILAASPTATGGATIDEIRFEGDAHDTRLGTVPDTDRAPLQLLAAGGRIVLFLQGGTCEAGNCHPDNALLSSPDGAVWSPLLGS